MEDQLSFDQNNKRSSLLFNGSTIRGAMYWRMNSDWMCNKWNVPNRVSCTRKTMRPPYEDTWTLAKFQFDDIILTDDPTDDVWSKVDHCLPRDDPRNMDDKCMLRISKVILIIVTALNTVKCICIALTIRLHNQICIDPRYSAYSNEKQGLITRAMAVIRKPKRSSKDDKLLYLVTLGDAMASFLRDDDKETQTCGLASKKDFAKEWPLHIRSSSRGSVRWYRVASLRRWVVTISLCVQLLLCDPSI